MSFWPVRGGTPPSNPVEKTLLSLPPRPDKTVPPSSLGGNSMKILPKDKIQGNFKVSKVLCSLFGKFSQFLLGLGHCFAKITLAKKRAVTALKNESGNLS